jgi:transcriptional regulator with XRE-family HTH domain
MDESEKIEEKKKYNAPFFRAFDHLAKDMGKNQQEMALHIGASPSLISDQRNGKKRVGEKYMTNLANAFNAFYQGEAHLYMNFLLGKSQYMIVENVPDSEISENLSREANPDYDVMKTQQQHASVHDQDLPLIMSKTYESMLKPIEASYAREIATLNQQIATLNSQLADKQSIIDLQADKIKSQADEIDSLQKVIDDLRAMPSSYDIEEYIRNNPFPVGVAEKQEQPREQV